jgi:hypothetical protein
MGGFQTQVNAAQAPAVEGDFASGNMNQYAALAGPGGLVAGDLGLTVGRFAWTTDEFVDADGAPSVANNFGSGPVAGFVHRGQQGLITTYLQEAGMAIPAGFQCNVMNSGDFWVKNNGATQALPGQKAYANYADGKASFAASGAPGTASGSASSIAAATSSFTASIADDVLDVTAVASGTIVPGTTISGTGVASGTKIVDQLSGAPGGIGTYAVSIPEQTVASETISGTYGVLTVGGTVTGVFGAGDTISGTNVVAGTSITQQLTGTTGGAGTYAVDNNTVVSSTAITAGTSIETKWICRSSGLPGELVKISSIPN